MACVNSPKVTSRLRWVPPPRQRRVVLTVAVALVTLAAGCGSGATPHAARAAAAITTRSAQVAAPAKRAPGLRPEHLPELRSTAHLAVVPWRLLHITGQGRTLEIAVTWSCGLPPIGERVEQTPSTVTVIIYAHRLPAGSACSGALGTGIITVTLAAPLTGRKLTR